MTDGCESILRQLMTRARAGDEQARDELFARCRNYLAIVARTQVESWLQRKVDASDLVQQSLLDAHRGFEKFRGETEQEWLAWLRRIVSHNATDYVRRYHGTAKRGKGKEIPLQTGAGDLSDAVFHDPADPTESPSQLVMQHEQEILVADAIARLSPDHQEVIQLRNLQRLPFEEIAARMGRSGPAVQMLWARAIRRLQELLNAESVSPRPDVSPRNGDGGR